MKFYIILTISALLFVGCGSQSTPNESQDVHTHDDGTEHGAHTDAETTPPSKQEEFSVGSDSTQKVKEDDHGHEHAEGDAH